MESLKVDFSNLSACDLMLLDDVYNDSYDDFSDDEFEGLELLEGQEF